jgi:hypothetical protein
VPTVKLTFVQSSDGKGKIHILAPRFAKARVGTISGKTNEAARTVCGVVITGYAWDQSSKVPPLVHRCSNCERMRGSAIAELERTA